MKPFRQLLGIVLLLDAAIFILHGSAQANIFEAINNGNKSQVLNLVDSQSLTQLAATNAQGETILHLAAKNGQTDIVSAVLEKAREEPEQLKTLVELEVSRTKFTPLFYAASSSVSTSLDCFAELVDNGNADMNRVDSNGRTVLHVAMSQSRLDIVKFILTKNVSSSTTQTINERSRTIGHIAANLNLTGVFDASLLELIRPALITKDSLGQTPMCHAASRGSVAFARNLVQTFGSDVITNATCQLVSDDFSRENVTGPVLHLAAQMGQIEFVIFLSNISAVNFLSLDSANGNVLHAMGRKSEPFFGIEEQSLTEAQRATKTAAERVIASLVNAITDKQKGLLTMKDIDGRTPYLVGVASGATMFVKAIEPKARGQATAVDSQGFTILHLAIDPIMFQRFADAASSTNTLGARSIGKSLDSADAGQMTPLMMAVRYRKSTRIIDYLIDSGVEVSALNDRNETLTHLAVQASNEEFLSHYSNLINVKALDAFGDTPVMSAVKLNSLAMLKLISTVITPANFSEALAIPNTMSGKLPIHEAVHLENGEMAEFLVSKSGHLLLARDKLGRTPLHLAIKDEALAMIDALLKRLTLEQKQSLFAMQENFSGQTLLHIAVERGCWRLVGLFLNSHGANCQNLNRASLNAVQWADTLYNQRMVELLYDSNKCVRQARVIATTRTTLPTTTQPATIPPRQLEMERSQSQLQERIVELQSRIRELESRTPPPITSTAPPSTTTPQTYQTFAPVTGSCETRETTLQDHGHGAAYFLDRQVVACPTNMLMQSFRMVTVGSQIKYIYICCSVTGLSECAMEYSSYSNRAAFNIPESSVDASVLTQIPVSCPSGKVLQKFQLARNSEWNSRYEYMCCKPTTNPQSCQTIRSEFQDTSAGSDPPANYYLDRQQVSCPVTSLLSSFSVKFNVNPSTNPPKQWQYEYKCCGSTLPINPEMRLRSAIGVVEVFRNGRWGTICDDGMTQKTAAVLCRMLGLPFAQASFSSLGDGSGFSPRIPQNFPRTWLDDLTCNGTEMSIAQCKHNGWGVHNCNQGENVVLRCEHSMRLVGGTTVAGIVEVQRDGTWGTICDDAVTPQTASVLCRMMGLPYATASFGGFGNGTFVGQTITATSTSKMWLDDLTCFGSEMTLDQCKHNPWGVHNCGASENLVLFCNSNLRMVGMENFGVVEVLRDNIWGTICDDSMNTATAAVLCRMMGLSYSEATWFTLGNGIFSGYGQLPATTDKIWLDDFRCDGDETSIDQCQHAAWGAHDCGASESVVLKCI